LTSNLFGCEKKKERLQKERREQQQEESNIMAAATDTDTPRATKRRAQERQLIKEGDADFDDEYSPPFATPLSSLSPYLILPSLPTANLTLIFPIRESAHRSEPPTSPESHRAIKQECPYCESRSFKNGYCDDCGESVVDDPALDVLNQYPATICFHPDIKDGVCQFDEDGVCVNCGGLLETRTAAATAGLGASSRSTDSQVVLDPNFCAHVSIREGVCETCGVAVDTECLNKACLIPKIKDGVCYNCGHVTGFDYMAGEEAEDDAEMEERGV
jgi:hypothetical protein